MLKSLPMPKILSAFAFFLILFLTNAFAQQMPKPSSSEIAELPQWAQLMYAAQPNVFEVQNAYQDFYRIHPFVKSYHTQYYKRWIRTNQYMINDAGFIQEPNVQLDLHFYLKKQTSQTKTSNWTIVGPITNYQEGLAQGSGQTNVYSFDQCAGQPNTCYCGTEPGEVYKSTDGGLNWQLVSKTIDFGSGVTAVEVHPTNANFILAGGNDGIFLSTDGAQNWVNTLPSSGLNVNEIYILPNDPNIVLAATDKGLYRSTDAAQTLKQLNTQKS
jgi:hypothetical protein